MKTIAITGGSGFIGRHLARKLTATGYKVVIYSRSKKANAGNLQYALWDPQKKEMDVAPLSVVTGVINLAGASVVSKRWTKARKSEILSSRIKATNFLIEQLREHAPQCKTFISASAIGYYGPDKGAVSFKESAEPAGDFLAQVCVQWEAAAQKATAFYRTVILRFGIVLGRNGGAYPELTAPMRLGVMPILGGGRQMVSWVHIRDLSAIIIAALEGEQYKGIYNCVAPNPVTHKALMYAIAAARGGINIPVPVPAVMLRVMMGESSVEVLKSCAVSADKIQEAGYVFLYPKIGDAANALVIKNT